MTQRAGQWLGIRGKGAWPREASPIEVRVATGPASWEWRNLTDDEADEILRRHNSPVGWGPIYTAPRNGTVIDVWLGDADEADVAFYCTPGTRRSPGWSWRDDKFRPLLGGLCISAPIFVQPTHWMPMPEGPP